MSVTVALAGFVVGALVACFVVNLGVAAFEERRWRRRQAAMAAMAARERWRLRL